MLLVAGGVVWLMTRRSLAVGRAFIVSGAILLAALLVVGPLTVDDDGSGETTPSADTRAEQGATPLDTAADDERRATAAAKARAEARRDRARERRARENAALASRRRVEQRRERERREAQPAPVPEPEPEPEPASDCASGYDPCVPPYPPDVDCPDVAGPISVTGDDPHGLDGDNNGVGCQ